MKLIVEQKRLGPRTYFVCVLAIYVMQILAIDLFVPALPSMQREFGVSEAYLNLTVFAFFVFSAAGIFVSGPISDRCGRRRLLAGACALFTASSALCAAAQSVEELVAFRILQALGYGATVTICTALIKDAFRGHDLKIAMTSLQSLIIIGPAAAPFAGTLIIGVADWRGVFVFLSVCGALSLVFSLLLSETRPRQEGSAGVGEALLSSFASVRFLLRDRSFTSLAVLMGVAGLPYFAWVATVSYILMDFFAASYLEYSLCYAATCLVTIAAPYIYVAISRFMSVRSILVSCIALTALGAVCLYWFGALTPFLFVAAMVPYTLAEGIVRPMAFVVLLDQPDEHVGTASSFSNFAYSILTSVGTVLATLPWANFVFGLAVLSAGSAVIMLGLYLFGLRGIGNRKRA